MTQLKIYVLEGGASTRLAHLWSEFFLEIRINFIRQFFYHTEFKPISKRQFETSKAMRILNKRHVISK
jgi:hypothetical protein